MPSKRINQIFSSLPFEKKILGVGSLLMILSLFLPWYQDLDSFKTGDTFFGFTGPLYLLGFSFFAMGAFNLTFMVMEIYQKKTSFLSIKYSTFYLATGIFAFYALIIVNSIYFHPKFGVNITVKQSQFGMFFAFIAASFITIGGYLTGRSRDVLLKEFQEETKEPLIKFSQPEIRKPKENLRTPVPVSQNTVEQTSFSDKNISEKTTPQSFRTDL